MTNETNGPNNDEREARAWWEGVNDQWKHRPIGNRVLEAANPYPRTEVPEPTVDEFRRQVADERARQIDDGYDILHDRTHGVDHLLTWAQDYARRGRSVQAAALVEAARELLSKSREPQGEPSDARVEASARRLFGATVDSMDRARELARVALTCPPLVACPHWAPGKVTFRNGCTSCAAEDQR